MKKIIDVKILNDMSKDKLATSVMQEVNRMQAKGSQVDIQYVYHDCIYSAMITEYVNQLPDLRQITSIQPLSDADLGEQFYQKVPANVNLNRIKEDLYIALNNKTLKGMKETIQVVIDKLKEVE